MQPPLTNIEWSHIIDSLKISAEDRLGLVNSMLPPHPADDSEKEAYSRIEWKAEAKRYRQLRRKLLAEERRSR
jgi:hypothetical protein